MDVISAEYADMQRQMHETYEYGVASKKYAHLVAEIIHTLEIDHLLDYGCGRHMNLFKSLKPILKRPIKYQGYDPGWPEFSDAPIPANLVCCIDVLEHIEPELLDNVLDHLKSLTEAACFLTVHTGPAGKLLPDGRNAHLIQEPMEWWLPKLAARWDLQTIQRTHAFAFHVIGYAKPKGLETVSGEQLAEQKIIS